MYGRWGEVGPEYGESSSNKESLVSTTGVVSTESSWLISDSGKGSNLFNRSFIFII